MFFGAADRVDWGSTVSTVDLDIDEQLGAGSLAHKDLDVLSATASGLRANLEQTNGVEGRLSASETLLAVRSYLRETVPQEDLAQLFMRLLLDTSDISVEIGVLDSLGRSGTPFLVTNAGADRIREAIILDSETGFLLEETRTLLTARASIDAKPPIMIGRVTYTTWGTTTSTAEAPNADN